MFIGYLQEGQLGVVLKISAGILFIWFPRKNLRQDSYKIWIGANVSSVPFDYDFSTASQSNRNN